MACLKTDFFKFVHPHDQLLSDCKNTQTEHLQLVREVWEKPNRNDRVNRAEPSNSDEWWLEQLSRIRNAGPSNENRCLREATSTKIVSLNQSSKISISIYLFC
jgi:hypothetical protein